MSEIATKDSSFTGISPHRYEKTNTNMIHYHYINVPGLPATMIYVNSGILGIVATVSTIMASDPLLIACGFALSVGSVLAGRKIHKNDKVEAIGNYTPGISKEDLKKVAEVAGGTREGVLEVDIEDGTRAYRFEFDKLAIKQTSYQLLPPKKMWDSNMEMFKSVYGIEQKSLKS